ncbi:diguanylate cyclase [Acetobacterium paludosum]|uniref:Diguanylate cyclase n=1 Tax=Acetobacterium paludosum TaxID=52693 RepID=A0A923I234_9FIRM|nr:sensor domain-containing diguanylate cyclase [Acetobacterium paludosum]MBC3888613.1 diguanylate cyclase [Acetobacterium paludosum]
MTLDIKTIVLINLIVSLVNIGVIAIIWNQYKKVFNGLSFLLADMILQFVGFLLIAFRGVIPDLWSVVVANSFVVIGSFFVLRGLEQFFNTARRNIHNYGLITIFVVVLSYFSLIQNNLVIREIVISVMLIVMNSQSVWLIFHRIDRPSRAIAKITGIFLAGYVLVSAARFVFLMIYTPETSEFFKTGLVDALALISYLTLSILIIMSFSNMVSRRLFEEVQTEKEKYNATFNSSPYAIMLTRLSDGKIFEVNAGFGLITGYEPSEVIGKTSLEIGLWVSVADRRVMTYALAEGNEVSHFEMQFQAKNDRLITGLVSSKIIMAHGEKCLVISISDITEMNEIKNQLLELATHDSLTGLSNRMLFYDRFEMAKANAQRNNHKIAVISLDVDHLKDINDGFGHDAGDKVLVTISDRISAILRKTDTFARFGGDEFMILLTEIDTSTVVAQMTDKILAAVAAPVDLGKDQIQVTASIGIVLYPDDGSEIQVLIKKSDQVMYQVKNNGRNNAQFYQAPVAGRS